MKQQANSRVIAAYCDRWRAVAVVSHPTRRIAAREMGRGLLNQMSYSASNTYATTEQLRKRLSTSGMTWAQDVDSADAYADSAEAVYGEEAVEYANVLCDEALAPHVSVVPRPANDWVKDRCIDIAAWRLVTLGGREPTPPLQLAYDEAVEKLAMVREGTLTVPGLNYNETLLNGQTGVPPIQVVNVEHSRRWKTLPLGCR